MTNYLFTGCEPRFYPNIVTGSGSLIALPGDVRTFDNPPTDGRWVETDLPEVIPGPRSWPIQPVPEPDHVAPPEAAPAFDAFNPVQPAPEELS